MSQIKETTMDKVSRRLSKFNPLLELLIVEGIYIIFNWVWLPRARIAGNVASEIAGLIMVGVVLIWMSFISHYFRGRNLDDLGCATPIKYKLLLKKFRNSNNPRNVLLFFGIYLLIFILFTTNIIDATKLLPVLGPLNMNLVPLIGNFAVVIISIIEYEVLLFFATRIMLKLENVKESFSANFVNTFPLLFVLILVTLIEFPERIESVALVDAMAYMFNYIFWAFVQQVPFMGYVNTQVREGLERQELITNHRARKFIAAGITGGIFAIVHFPAWTLSIIAGFMSFFLSFAYYEKETRNMFMTCIFHAIFGLIVVFFFDINMQTTYTALFQ
ncbi:hypothetical protein GF325_02375 [Candidatus Bathyarchaeota archaeon]|nr:hypothetical protein [Candidatus Bathyarchaeota archaeon]